MHKDQKGDTHRQTWASLERICEHLLSSSQLHFTGGRPEERGRLVKEVEEGSPI